MVGVLLKMGELRSCVDWYYKAAAWDVVSPQLARSLLDKNSIRAAAKLARLLRSGQADIFRLPAVVGPRKPWKTSV